MEPLRFDLDEEQLWCMKRLLAPLLAAIPPPLRARVDSRNAAEGPPIPVEAAAAEAEYADRDVCDWRG
jgi:hypothetical protein